jgi:hypothetical protein
VRIFISHIFLYLHHKPLWATNGQKKLKILIFRGFFGGLFFVKKNFFQARAKILNDNGDICTHLQASKMLCCVFKNIKN